MLTPKAHSFHIPVMGIGYTIDTPLKVAKYGINSVVSIIEDELLEQLRKRFSLQHQLPYIPITKKDIDYRAKRITAYLNLLHDLVTKQFNAFIALPLEAQDMRTYFDLLPPNSELKSLYQTLPLLNPTEQHETIRYIKQQLVCGSIDVNIMTKVDNPVMDENNNPMPSMYSAAHAALRGFAESQLTSSVVFSAGLNPKLYSYCAQFDDFFPNENGVSKKKIILKVSDYRSALIQGKFFAKKGLWVDEFRVESGLNCGGHAFATDGYLLGPILEEFKQHRTKLQSELLTLCNQTLSELNKPTYPTNHRLKITAQGGVGTDCEHEFLLNYYELDSIGWGSPFLLVPQATTVDTSTLNKLAVAKPDDYYLSYASPLGVPFNNFKPSSAETQRKHRIERGKAGSPCLKKYLQFNTEFTKDPICTASVKYQYFKQQQLKNANLTREEYTAQLAYTQEKDCLCEGLSEPAVEVHQLKATHRFNAVTICPGPNLAFFSGIFTLKQMVDHLYGRVNLLNKVHRPNLFINELKLYITFLTNEQNQVKHKISERKESYFEKFSDNLMQGINYYHLLIDNVGAETQNLFKGMRQELDELTHQLKSIAYFKEEEVVIV